MVKFCFVPVVFPRSYWYHTTMYIALFPLLLCLTAILSVSLILPLHIHRLTHILYSHTLPICRSLRNQIPSFKAACDKLDLGGGGGGGRNTKWKRTKKKPTRCCVSILTRRGRNPSVSGIVISTRMHAQTEPRLCCVIATTHALLCCLRRARARVLLARLSSPLL